METQGVFSLRPFLQKSTRNWEREFGHRLHQQTPTAQQRQQWYMLLQMGMLLPSYTFYDLEIYTPGAVSTRSFKLNAWPRTGERHCGNDRLQRCLCLRRLPQSDCRRGSACRWPSLFSSWSVLPPEAPLWPEGTHRGLVRRAFADKQLNDVTRQQIKMLPSAGQRA